MNTFLKVDERLFELLKQDYEMQDIVLLSILLRKSELKKSDVFFISHAEFKKAFNLSPYQVRSAMKRLSRWVTVKQARRIGINRYSIHKSQLEEDLQKLNNNACNEFYFDKMIIKDTDVEISELKDVGHKLEEIDKVSVTFPEALQKSNKFFSLVVDKISLSVGKGRNPLKILSNRVKNFHKRIFQSAHNLLTEITDLTDLIKKRKKRKKGTENSKIQKNKKSGEKITTLNSGKTETSSESNCYLTNSDSSGKRKRGRPPKSERSSTRDTGVNSAENSESLPTLGGMTPDEFRRLLHDYWSRQPSETEAFQKLVERLDQTTLSDSVKEIIKTFIWWFPADMSYLKPEQFLRLWFKPCLHFAENPVNFKYFVHLFSSQWYSSQRPEQNQRQYAMLAPLGSWAFMRKAIINYNQRSKAGIYDAYSHSPYPVNFAEFRETAPKFLGNML